MTFVKYNCSFDETFGSIESGKFLWNKFFHKSFFSFKISVSDFWRYIWINNFSDLSSAETFCSRKLGLFWTMTTSVSIAGIIHSAVSNLFSVSISEVSLKLPKDANWHPPNHRNFPSNHRRGLESSSPVTTCYVCLE